MTVFSRSTPQASHCSSWGLPPWKLLPLPVMHRLIGLPMGCLGWVQERSACVLVTEICHAPSSLFSLAGELPWSSRSWCSFCSATVAIAEPEAPAIKLSRRRVRARCTLSDNPGEMYSLGILCIPATHNAHAIRCHYSVNQRRNKNFSFSLILRCVPHTLIDDLHFRWRPHSILPQDACRTSWQVMCSQLHLDVPDKNKNSADLWQLAKIHSHPTANACTTLHTWPQNRTQWFLRIKTHDMSAKMKIFAKHMTVEIKTDHTRSHKSKFCPVRNHPKLWNFKKFYTATANRLCQRLVLQPSSQVNQKSIRSNLCYKPLKTIFMASDPNLYKRLPYFHQQTTRRWGRIHNQVTEKSCLY